LRAFRSEVDSDEPLKSVKIVRVEFNVVVPGTFDPQRREDTWSAFVDCQTMTKVDHFIVCAVNHKDRGLDARHFAVADTHAHNSHEHLSLSLSLSFPIFQLLLTQPTTLRSSQFNVESQLRMYESIIEKSVLIYNINHSRF